MKNKSPVGLVLEAIDKGAVSVEEVVRQALRNPDGLEKWLDRRMKGDAAQLPRRQRLRKVRTFPEDVAVAAVKKAKRLLAKRSDVVSVHWGVRHFRGRATSEPVVVVYLKEKRPLRELTREDHLPDDVEISHQSRHYKVRIDVQGAGLPGAFHSVAAAMPGERAGVLIGDDNIVDGALGVLVDVPGEGLKAVLSGHVAERKGLRVRGQFLDQAAIDLGVVLKIVEPPDGDAALAGPVNVSALNILVSPVRPFRDPGVSDLTFKVLVHTLRDFNPIPSFIDGVGVTGLFTKGGEAIAINDLVSLFPQVTNDGDSGGAVLDSTGSIVGFVVGDWNGKTYLMPARRAINALVP
jgi:hypothetical protein